MKTSAAAILVSLAITSTSCNNKPDYDATGIFEATTVTVSAETQGRILEFPVAEGDSVAENSFICQIDTTLLALQSLQVGSQRGSAEASSPDIAAQASALRSEIAHQRNECERINRLLADGAATDQQHDDAQARLTSLQGQLNALLSSLGKSRTSISDNAAAMLYQEEQIAENIAKCRIEAPVAGTVLVKYAEAGEYAVPGKPLLKIADLDRIYLRAYFTARQLADVRLGQKVTVIADFGAGETYDYPGTVTWIAQDSEFTPKSIQTESSRANLVYAVKIAVENDGRLKLGQYGEVRL